MFSLNQIVKGVKCGTFVIIGFRQIDGEQYAQLKHISPVTGKPMRGELALPLTSIQAVGV